MTIDYCCSTWHDVCTLCAPAHTRADSEPLHRPYRHRVHRPRPRAPRRRAHTLRAVGGSHIMRWAPQRAVLPAQNGAGTAPESAPLEGPSWRQAGSLLHHRGCRRPASPGQPPTSSWMKASSITRAAAATATTSPADRRRSHQLPLLPKLLHVGTETQHVLVTTTSGLD
jgi:hypothetical protein